MCTRLFIFQSVYRNGNYFFWFGFAGTRKNKTSYNHSVTCIEIMKFTVIWVVFCINVPLSNGFLVLPRPQVVVVCAVAGADSISFFLFRADGFKTLKVYTCTFFFFKLLIGTFPVFAR